MKKSLSLLLACALLALAMPCALADGTTTLTTTVPASATYTLNIPADQNIEFGTLSTELTVPYITQASGFAAGKNVQVTMTYTDFTSKDVDTTLPVSISGKYSVWNSNYREYDTYYVPLAKSGSTLLYKGESSGGVGDHIYQTENKTVEFEKLRVSISGWGSALGGDYSSTITFTSKVI